MWRVWSLCSCKRGSAMYQLAVVDCSAFLTEGSDGGKLSKTSFVCISLLELTKKGNIASHSRDPVCEIRVYSWASTAFQDCGSQYSPEIWMFGSTNPFRLAFCNAREVDSTLASNLNELACGRFVRRTSQRAFASGSCSGIGCREDELSDGDTQIDLFDGKTPLLSTRVSSIHHFECSEIGSNESTHHLEGGQNVSITTEQGVSIDCCRGGHDIPKDVVDDNTAEDAIEKDVAGGLSDLDEAIEIVHNGELEDKEQQPANEKICQNLNASSDFYEEVKITADAGEPLMPRSLLDLAVEDIVQEENEQGHLLYQKFKKAAARGCPFTCKSVADSWLEEGNIATRPALIHTILAFWSWKKNKRALELLDWVMTEKPFELTDMDYAIYMDLVGKIDGYRKASKYYTQIPKSFQTSMVYSVLLAAYVDNNMERCARKLLARATLMGVTELVFLYNQVLLFFKGKGRISDVADLLKEMEDHGVNADLYTYNIILDLRARKGDVMEMRRIWKTLEKEKNLKPDAASYAILARGYINAGSRGKAELAIKHIEVSPYLRKQLVYRWLLKLYAHLKREDELERVWELVKNVSRALVDDYSIMIQSLGKAGELKRAEEVFEEGVNRFGIKRLHQYHALISVYLNHGMIQKAEDLIEKMSRDSFNPGSATYHQLIEMHVKNGDERKAMEILSKAQNASKIFSGQKPWYASYLIILEMFGDKGNVEHAELIIKNLKSAGYPCGFKMYSALLKAYVKANMTPYGFLDRMRADGAIPNSCIRKELYKVSGTERGMDMVSGQPF